MSFQIPDQFFTLASAAGNAQSTKIELEKNALSTRESIDKVNHEIQVLRKALLEATQQGKDSPCPYCAQLIAKQALICNYCQGVLSIGSAEAIRAAVLINPKLSFRTEEMYSELVQVVQQLDAEFERQLEVEKAAADQRKRELAESTRLRIAENKRKQAAIDHEIQREAALAKQKIEEDALRKAERIANLPFARRMIVRHKTASFLILIALVLTAFAAQRNAQQHAHAAADAKTCSLIKVLPVYPTPAQFERLISQLYNVDGKPISESVKGGSWKEAKVFYNEDMNAHLNVIIEAIYNHSYPPTDRLNKLSVFCSGAS